jgi:hypothetical protein
MIFLTRTTRILPVLIFFFLLTITGCTPQSPNTPVSVPNLDCPYSFNKAPYINPRIIQDLSCWISDQGDQVVAINILESQKSNRYFSDPKATETKGKNPFISVESAVVESGQTNISSFCYQLVGQTSSGVYVLGTSDSGGGSAILKNLMLVKFEYNNGISCDLNKDVIGVEKKRLLIKKLGEIALGDRWDGELSVVGNSIRIGKDNGVFAGTDKGGALSATPTNRVIKIDLER